METIRSFSSDGSIMNPIPISVVGYAAPVGVEPIQLLRCQRSRMTVNKR